MSTTQSSGRVRGRPVEIPLAYAVARWTRLAEAIASIAYEDLFEMHTGVVAVADGIGVLFSNRGVDHWLAVLPELRRRLEFDGYVEGAIAYAGGSYTQAMVVRLPPRKSVVRLHALLREVVVGNEQGNVPET